MESTFIRLLQSINGSSLFHIVNQSALLCKVFYQPSTTFNSAIFSYLMAKISYSIILLLDGDLCLVQKTQEVSHGDTLHDWYQCNNLSVSGNIYSIVFTISVVSSEANQASGSDCQLS